MPGGPLGRAHRWGPWACGWGGGQGLDVWGGCGVRGASSRGRGCTQTSGGGPFSLLPLLPISPSAIADPPPGARPSRGGRDPEQPPLRGGQPPARLDGHHPREWPPPRFRRGKEAAGGAELSLRWAPGLSCRIGEFGAYGAPGLTCPCSPPMPRPFVEWPLLVPGLLGEGGQAHLLCGQSRPPC